MPPYTVIANPQVNAPTALLTSYGMNINTRAIAALNFHFKISRYSGADVCYWENDEKSTNAQVWNDGVNLWNEPVTQRHKYGINIACMGGYVEWMTYDKYAAMRALLPGRVQCCPDGGTNPVPPNCFP
jgi:hypothetical protein